MAKTKSDNPWDELQPDAVGDHDWLISEIKTGNFNNGESFTEARGVLTSGGGINVGFTIGDNQPSDDETKAEAALRKSRGKGDWEDAMFQSVVSTKSRLWELEKHYGKTFDQVAVNDVFRVRTVRNKKGYIVIIKFLPATGSTAGTAAGMSGVPF